MYKSQMTAAEAALAAAPPTPKCITKPPPIVATQLANFAAPLLPQAGSIPNTRAFAARPALPAG